MKKNILINGAINEIGTALAKAFRTKGYYVYGLDKKEDYDGICDRSLRFDIRQFVTDAGYRIRFSQIMDEIAPRLNALINIEEINLRGHLKDIQLDDWQQSMDVNLTGPMLLSKLFVTKLEKSKGAILNIGNIAFDNSEDGQMAYLASKNALNGLTSALAIDLKGRVVVNSITMMMEGEKGESSAGKGNLKNYADELAKLAVYLVNENAGLIHGQDLLLQDRLIR